MDNTDHNEALDMEAPAEGEHRLWLTDELMKQLQASSKIGLPLIILCLLLGASFTLMELAIYFVSNSSGYSSDDYYLFEGNNLLHAIKNIGTISILFCFFKASFHGYKSWLALRRAASDDDALLGGSEELPLMFKWFAYWGGAVVVFILIGVMLSSR